MQTTQWEHAALKFEGLSLAGVRTCVTLPQFSIAFDIAQGLPHAIGMNNFLITHGHMDHASGIPYIISQKAMHSHKVPRFFMPEYMLAPMKEIMNQWSKIEGHSYDYEFIGAKSGDEFEIKPNLFVRAFTTVHRVPSLGYSLYRKSHRLRSELDGLTSAEIADFRKQGNDPSEQKTELLVSFTGDTQIEFLDRSPEVRSSKILMMETTYLDLNKSVANAREWGHTHLEELISRLDTIYSEKIVLIHSSARYSIDEALHILKTRLPTKDQERVVLFLGR